jgi:hypothetical protein
MLIRVEDTFLGLLEKLVLLGDEAVDIPQNVAVCHRHVSILTSTSVEAKSPGGRYDLFAQVTRLAGPLRSL